MLLKPFDLSSGEKLAEMKDAQKALDAQEEAEEAGGVEPPPPKVMESLGVFEEPICFDLESSVPEPEPFGQLLQKQIDASRKLRCNQGVSAGDQTKVDAIVEAVKGSMVENLKAAKKRHLASALWIKAKQRHSKGNTRRALRAARQAMSLVPKCEVHKCKFAEVWRWIEQREAELNWEENNILDLTILA